jgi:hypothetical protein
MSDYLRNFQTREIDQQLTTDTGIYASGDVLVATVAVPLVGATIGDMPRVKIEQITIIDKDALSGAFDIVILDDNKSLGTINAAVSISDADSLSVVKTVSVTSSNYTTLTSGGQAVANIDLAAPIYVQPPAGANSFYIGLISRDTKTYTASALYLRLAVQFIDRSV